MFQVGTEQRSYMAVSHQCKQGSEHLLCSGLWQASIPYTEAFLINEIYNSLTALFIETLNKNFSTKTEECFINM